MKKKEFVIKKYFEREEYDYNGIKVLIEIDYKNEKISMVENNGHDSYVPKRYNFSGRGVNYMQGWRDILNAMTLASVEAEAKLRSFIDKKERNEVKLIAKAMKEI